MTQVARMFLGRVESRSIAICLPGVPRIHMSEIPVESEQDAIAALERLGSGIIGRNGAGHVNVVSQAETNVTDPGFVHVKAFCELEFLDLDDTNVGNAGLMHLTGLTGLKTLLLSNTKVTDAGLEHLDNNISIGLLF